MTAEQRGEKGAVSGVEELRKRVGSVVTVRGAGGELFVGKLRAVEARHEFGPGVAPYLEATVEVVDGAPAGEAEPVAGIELERAGERWRWELRGWFDERMPGDLAPKWEPVGAVTGREVRELLADAIAEVSGRPPGLAERLEAHRREVGGLLARLREQGLIDRAGDLHLELLALRQRLTALEEALGEGGAQ